MARRIGLLLAFATLLVAAPAPAADLEATRAALERQMRGATPASGAYVVDLGSGEEIAAVRADTRRIPASVEKLYTTAVALLRLGAATTVQTGALALVAPDADGVLDGDLYLRGGGDPTLGQTDLDTLAAAVANTAGISEITGRVIGDETLFDDLRGPPSSRWKTSAYVGPLSALSFNRGRTGLRRPYWEVKPAGATARAFARALKRHDVDVSVRAARTGPTPEGASTIAAVESPTFGELARLANTPSDNFIAEMLLKGIGAREAGEGSTLAGARIVRKVLATIGVAPRVIDGSGLSRSNLTSPREVVDLLAHMASSPLYADFRRSLAIAGRTGTLSPRLRTSAARDRCRGKTGTLQSVSALAGYCQTRGGRLVAFAILMNRASPYYSRKRQDRMVDALARYAPASQGA